MNIAIIGSGHIGAGLARAWAKKGHSLVFGTRTVGDPELLALCKETHGRATTIAAAPSDAEVVVLAMPYGALEEVLQATETSRARWSSTAPTRSSAA